MTLDRLIISVVGVIVLLSSCDTRDDYFLKHGADPQITLYSDHDSTVDGKRYIFVELGWGDTVEVNYAYEDKYGELSNHMVQTICTYNPRQDAYYWSLFDSPESKKVTELGDPTAIGEHITMELDPLNQKLLFVERTQSAESFYNRRGRAYLDPDSLSFQAMVTLDAYNVIGKKGSAHIFVKAYANKPPMAGCVVEPVPGESSMHRRIVAQCSDPDGDPIIAYEYCIDGKTIGFGNVYEIGGVITSGQAAYNGTYITSTSLSAVNHVFQEKGAHTISIRCEDIWRNWSSWNTSELIIE